MNRRAFLVTALSSTAALVLPGCRSKRRRRRRGGTTVKVGAVNKADGTKKRGVVVKGRNKTVKVGKVKKADGTVKRGVVVKKRR